jgi:DNA-binding transcriptional regulator YiaG
MKRFTEGAAMTGPTKTLRQMVGELEAPSSTAGGSSILGPRIVRGPRASARTSVKPKRKKLPRTFDRSPKPWMQPVLELPKHTSGEMLAVRREVLGLSRADAARLLRVARNTIWDWETGYRSAPFSAYALLRVLADQGRHRGAAPDPTAGAISVPLALEARAVRLESHRKYARGELAPLGINPATGKRRQSTGRYPKSGFLSPILKPDDSTPRVSLEGRFKSRRERANELRDRMARFSAIYNAGYMVRNAYFGLDARQEDTVKQFIAVLLSELRSTSDYTACLFAVADALYASPSGVPWDA